MEIAGIKFFSAEADKESYPFVCQCVIGSGSNTESNDKNGIFHLIEHYVINSSYENEYFKNVKIHGYTYFYYTCYYWYAKTKEEAVGSFRWFRDVLDGIICNTSDYRIFEGSKRQIEEEVEHRKSSTDMLYKIIQALDAPQNVRLPIGNIEFINEMQHNEVVSCIKEFYLKQNMYKFIYDRRGKIFAIDNDKFADLNFTFGRGTKCLIGQYQDHNRIIKDSLQIYHQQLGSNSIKILFQNNFLDSISDVVYGEIFLMLLCQYISNCISLKGNVQYERFFLSKEKMYFVVSISELSAMEYSCLDCIKELSYKKLFDNIVDEKNYIKIRNSIIEFLQNDGNAVFDEAEIRADLINFAVLSYPSYNLMHDHTKLIGDLSKFDYIQFKNYIIDIFFARDIEIKIII